MKNKIRLWVSLVCIAAIVFAVSALRKEPPLTAEEAIRAAPKEAAQYAKADDPESFTAESCQLLSAGNVLYYSVEVASPSSIGHGRHFEVRVDAKSGEITEMLVCK